MACFNRYQAISFVFKIYLYKKYLLFLKISYKNNEIFASTKTSPTHMFNAKPMGTFVAATYTS